ncbi:nucleotide 5'-monophosphate nucleosidase PpnN [Oleiphilus sp. HI0132]|uniref:nucleotide 5'-monophosphate nucleosidase PpnN n=2 Tax=Oleiphilus TaxID=141450 RepID=UPI000AEAA7E7
MASIDKPAPRENSHTISDNPSINILPCETMPYATVSPEGSLEILSAYEVKQLVELSRTKVYELFKRCALAVLNTGSTVDDTNEIIERYKDFSIKFIRQSRGIKLLIENAPGSAFVDGKMIRGIREQLFSVLRDVLYVQNQLLDPQHFDFEHSKGITDAVFHILRNANLLRKGAQAPLIVCWGGHSINRCEYEFTKEVGYQLGLREANIITGCGPGAMKGPMKGATIGHAKQHFEERRYIGITEPGIIAAESPNPIVNELVILPDIEKRLEAFVRCGHGVIVFPGGVGTAEEILYILGILLHPKNAKTPFPLVFAAGKESEAYFKMIDDFIGQTLGEEAQEKYQIITDNPGAVAQHMVQTCHKVFKHRRSRKDAYFFNWQLHIDHQFQKTFEPTHPNMANLDLSKNQEPHILAANLRKAFSGIVAGNVKEQGLKAIAEHGSFKITGDLEIIEPLDKLLRTFVDQRRMKLGDKEYKPCYEVVS